MNIIFIFWFLLIILIFFKIECYDNTKNLIFESNNGFDNYYSDNDKSIFEKRLLYESYKYFNNSMLLINTPRNKNNKYLPYTLGIYDIKNKTIQPFPNEDYNDYKNNSQTCENFISVVSFEIDEENTIYVLDEGNEKCTSKLYELKLIDDIGIEKNIFDTRKKINEENITLNNFVIDKINNYAYIIYTKKNNLKYSTVIIGINLGEKENNIITKELNIGYDENYSIPDSLKNFNNILPDFTKKIISCSLSCDGETLFISPFSNRKIYSISTEDIREQEKDNIHINEAYKDDATSSLIASDIGNLYFAGIEKKFIYIIGQINNDLSDLNYKSFDKIEITENISYISTISLTNGNLYLTYKKFINDTYLESGYIKKQIEEENDYENAYIFKCSGLNYKYDWKSSFVWIIFVIIFVFIFIFVLVENKQDLEINKKEN